MPRKVLTLLLALALITPATGGITVGLLANPALVSCAASTLVVGPIPDSLTSTTRDGDVVTLTKRQLERAATVISVGAATAGVGRTGVLIALMAALTESGLRMLANATAYPESTAFANDGDGSDHDSLGMFQMRPAAGWGTVAQLMDADYQARAFFGGASGPNGGSPRGLLDVPGWQRLTPGEAAQTVEVSAYPDRYDAYQPVAEDILTALTSPKSSTVTPGDVDVPDASVIVFPLAPGTYTFASGFGWRTDPFTGRPRLHAGIDLAAPTGTPILAIADGVVIFAGPSGGYGNLIIVRHRVGGSLVDSYYGHMWADGVHVAAGETVSAGQHIGDVGSAGRSEGPHLHFELHAGGPPAEPVDPAAWLEAHGAADADPGAFITSTCTPGRNA